MKCRKWALLGVLALLLTALAFPAYAYTHEYVHDDAYLVSATKAVQLNDKAAEISERYGCGVYIVVVLDYSEYGTDVRSAAENYFIAGDFGIGSGDNGVLLFMSMAERDYALIAHGAIGNGAFTDYGKELLSEEFLDNFRYDDWAGGFADYLSFSERLLESYVSGTPVDVKQGSGAGMTLLMVLLVPALIAGISCGVMAASMKTAKVKTNANDYIQNRGIQLTGRHDRFLTRTVVRQKIESSSSSRGGSRVNSGGFSGRSGKF